MKAIISNKYGPPDVLDFTDVDKPVPSDDQVLVKIHAASVNYGNLIILKGELFLVRLACGLLKPKYAIPGGDMAGRVEAVGRNVKQFQPGDDVFGDLSACGWGAFAEYASVPEQALALKPTNISFEEASAVPMAAVTALQALRDKGKIQPGQKVLIHGASGGVGTFAVQIAASFGAEVTGVCSTRNIDMLRSIGADHVIDYTNSDFSLDAERYDLILAINGYQPISVYKRALKPNGIYVMIGGSGAQLGQAAILGPLISLSGSKKMGNMLQKPNQKDLLYIKQLLESEKIRPIIDKTFPLSEAAQALAYIEEVHAQGKVVLTV